MSGRISVLITIYQHRLARYQYSCTYISIRRLDISTGAPYISKRWHDISTYHYISACLAGYQYLSLYISMSGSISVLITIYQHPLTRYQYSCTYISIHRQDIRQKFTQSHPPHKPPAPTAHSIFPSNTDSIPPKIPEHRSCHRPHS